MDHFSTNFLGPVEEENTEDAEEEDGLGYYEDGVKRTLTDAQIAIFRHSEIQTLLRERRHATEAAGDAGEGREQTREPAADKGESEDGELVTETENTNNSSATPSISNAQQHLTRKARKAEQAKQKGYFKQKIKPDLRKRTWDKVDVGMGSLDYDDQSSASPAASSMSQRRKISYDD